MRAKISIDKSNVISAVDDRLYSSFIEHMGRAVYTGIYEPTHPTADEQGFRRDVADLIRPLNLSHIRYPGGNFLSGYNWMDGIGPKESRPMRPDLAWFALEPNQVGTDEFLQWCERVGVEPMMAVNLGTGTPESAAHLLEYVNSDLPTSYADMRRSNGHQAPYNVKLWCLGNEMDGPWQICHKTAEEYGRTACETAKMMKWLDPDIELVVCGSSFKDMPTFGDWERTVLRHCWQHVDYLSLHQYYHNTDDDLPTFLSRNLEMDQFIKEVAGIVTEIKAEKKSDKSIYLSFDEWNVWYHYAKNGVAAPKWIVARPTDEEDYNLADALVVGMMMNTLINNSDTVKIACLAQLVNALAAIMTEPGGKAWAQTIYYPFMLASLNGRGTALRVSVDAPSYACAAHEQVPYIDCSAVLQQDGSVVIFAVNRSTDESATLDLTDSIGAEMSVTEWITFTGESAYASNTADTQAVAPVNMTESLANSRPPELPPLSWNMLRLESGNQANR